MQIKKLGFFFIFNIFLATFSFTQSATGFKFVANEPHYLLITITDRELDIPDVRAEVTKYVWRNHAADKLKVTHILIGKNRSINAILLEEFTDKKHAMNFYNKLQKKKPDFMQMGLTKEFLVISKSNYEQMLRNESLNGYADFFTEKYLK